MRLDVYLQLNGYADSRTRAQNMIREGLVSVDGKVIDKPSYLYDGGEIQTAEHTEYVSRGGLKLEEAFRVFDLDVNGFICADLGASTGGFTECLLRHGATRVFAIDCGSGQLHPSLLADSRVVSMENLNARYVSRDTVGCLCDAVTADISFISQTKIHSAAASLLRAGGIFISLVKPQFEVGRGKVGKNGILRLQSEREAALEAVIASAARNGFACLGNTLSPIKGGDGNIEYLAVFRRVSDDTGSQNDDNKDCTKFFEG